MPRQARNKSSTGVYHVMLRGIDGQDIFLDRADRLKFLETLLKYKDSSEYQLYGYCLMSNHIHLIIKEGKDEIARIMKRIGVSYAAWYNNKYERTGHLFQDRFKSEEIEDDRYLLVALRYIHQNPLKAEIVKTLAGYEWSSFNEYRTEENALTDTAFILSIFHADPVKASASFEEFMQQQSADRCLDHDNGDRKKINDEKVVKLLSDLSGVEEKEMLSFFDKQARDDLLLKLRQSGATIRQLERLTGLGRGAIERVTRQSR